MRFFPPSAMSARTEPRLLQTHHLIRDHYHGAAAYIPFSATAPTSILRATAPADAGDADADADAEARATPSSTQRTPTIPPRSAATPQTPSLFAGQRSGTPSQRVAAIWDAERQPRKSSQAPVTQIGRPVLGLHPAPPRVCCPREYVAALGLPCGLGFCGRAVQPWLNGCSDCC